MRHESAALVNSTGGSRRRDHHRRPNRLRDRGDALEQAELAGLSPELRAQVKARAVGGNSVAEVLQVTLLNNIKLKHEASLIVAMDWAKGVAVVRLLNGSLEVVNFDPRTLQIKS